MVYSLRWVDIRNPARELVTLTCTEAFTKNMHPCHVWGDLVVSPAHREEMGPPPEWPPRDLETLGSPAAAGFVLPAVRGPGEREAAAVPPVRSTTGPMPSPSSAIETPAAGDLVHSRLQLPQR